MTTYRVSQRSDQRRWSGKRRAAESVTTKRVRLPCPPSSSARRQSSRRAQKTVPSFFPKDRRPVRRQTRESLGTSLYRGSSKSQLPATCRHFSSPCKRACLVVVQRRSDSFRSRVVTRCSHATRLETVPTTIL